MDNTHGLYVALTIERQLKMYSECENHTERHETLWHEWNHNKRWLAQIQQMILPSFPSYSKHDVSHSESVMHNIEMLMGEENIKSLSATDCFVILHTVYIHDIGMIITHKDRQNIMKNEKFHEFLEYQMLQNDDNLKYYAEVLLKEYYGNDAEVNSSKEEKTENDIEERNELLQEKLDIYYAIIYLIAEFRRKEHGDVSCELLKNWIDEPGKLGYGFSTIGVPIRIFYMIANCASTHTKWDFNEVMKLPQSDTGYAHDYMHPRFVAVLLQLGDALDMDNDRFHPIAFECISEPPHMSKIHYNKHKSVRVLKITNTEIEIKADCESASELRVLRTEYDGIKDLLSKATLNWAAIKPDDSVMNLPVLKDIELLLKGMHIPHKLVKAKFNISQEKAFQLIKGNNIYSNEGLVFLRELIQNALDASKIQYYRDLGNKLEIGKDVENYREMPQNPDDADMILPLKEYPIRIRLLMRKYKQSLDGTESCEPFSQADLENPREMLKDYDCGVLVQVQDYATGISGKEILDIADVGSSYKARQDEICKMPDWLKPTGEFGIGLQSAFLAGNKLKAISHTRTGEYYKIEFNCVKTGWDGYINVVPSNDNDEKIPYGTRFEIFVSNKKRRFCKESQLAWNGEDPFEDEYMDREEIRYTIELAQQMAIYINKISGAVFFPISVNIEIPNSELLFEKRNTNNENDEEKLQKSWTVWREDLRYPDIDVKISRENNKLWAYNKEYIFPWENHNNDKLIFKKKIDRDVFWFDFEQMKLYVWCNENATMGRFGVRELIKFCYEMKKSKNTNIKIPARIYYKGMYVAQKRFVDDSNLLEYMDVKKKLERSYLKLSRDGFSEEGQRFLDETYRKLLNIAQKAFEYMDSELNEENIDKIVRSIQRCLDEYSDNKMILKKLFYKKILGITALSYFGLLTKTDEMYVNAHNNPNENWNKLIKIIRNSFSEQIKKYLSDSKIFNFPCKIYKDNIVIDKENGSSVLDFVDTDNRYLIFSKRNTKREMWTSYLVEAKEVYNMLKPEIKKLRSEQELINRRPIINKIEKIGKQIFSVFFKENDEYDLGDDIQKISYHLLVKWILTNIPTMALFSSEDGKIRINVLDHEICDSVYCDATTKKLMLERMVDIYEQSGCQRFSTMTWTGYSMLKLNNVDLPLRFVKRGKLARIGYGEMLLPLDGARLKEIVNMQGDQDDVSKRINSMSYAYNDDMKKYLNFKKTLIKDSFDDDNIVENNSAGENTLGKVSEFEYKAMIRKVFNDFKETDKAHTHVENSSDNTSESVNNVNINSLTRELHDAIINEISIEAKNGTLSSNESSYDTLTQLVKKELFPIRESILACYSGWIRDMDKQLEGYYKLCMSDMHSRPAYNNMLEYTKKRLSYTLDKKQLDNLFGGVVYELIDSVFLTLKHVGMKRIVSDFEEMLDNAPLDSVR